MPILQFLVICLAAWNLSSLLVQEEGPFHMFAHLRYFMGVDIGPDMALYKRYGIGRFHENIAEVFMCIWCMSRWTAAALIILYMLFPIATLVTCAIFAASTVVIAIDNWNSK